jgi:hypothetical protein
MNTSTMRDCTDPGRPAIWFERESMFHRPAWHLCADDRIGSEPDLIRKSCSILRDRHYAAIAMKCGDVHARHPLAREQEDFRPTTLHPNHGCRARRQTPGNFG